MAEPSGPVEQHAHVSADVNGEVNRAVHVDAHDSSNNVAQTNGSSTDWRQTEVVVPPSSCSCGASDKLAAGASAAAPSFARAWISDRLTACLSPWELSLQQHPAVSAVGCDMRGWLCKHTDYGDTWRWTHVSMREALEAHGAVAPVRFYLLPAHSPPMLYCAWSFCSLLVGHPEIVHGGASAFAFDESFGVLFAMLNLGPGFTANINVNYRKPLPADLVACLHASLDKREGRKVYLKGSLRSAPDGDVFSEATALFIIPRQQTLVQPPPTA